MISGRGTAKSPIRICGVPGPDGQLPVIDGQDATTRPQLDFPFDGHQVRGLVIIGHAHGQPWENTPSHIIFEGFEVRNAAPPNAFTDRSGKKSAYSPIAAGIFVERANNLIIRGCTVTGNNNGIFVGTGGGAVALTQNVLLEQNYIHDNGSLADYYEHNVYNEAANVVYQYNRFGPPRAGRSGILGANIKERSAGVVIRYNWIEDGAHILDIVDAQESKDVTRSMPSFHATYVYGNVIIRGTRPTGSMILYGGDSGVLEDYRKGTLFFYNNTVVVKNDRYPDYTNTAIFELSTNEEHLDSRNNVYFSTVEPKRPSRDRHARRARSGKFGGGDVCGRLAEEGLDRARPHAWLEGRSQGADPAISTRWSGAILPGFRDSTAEEYSLVGPGSVGCTGGAWARSPGRPLADLPVREASGGEGARRR